MREVLQQWHADGHAPWKIPTFLSLAGTVPVSGKRSTPYGPGTVHDYMHAKIVVADDVAFVGSYNLSHSGEENAENVLEIAHHGLADRLAGYIDRVRSTYPPLRLEAPTGSSHSAVPPPPSPPGVGRVTEGPRG
jgi:phosphatidylserine/phosphatidylglycerophosphate/cardiolipin synthase-like enzyme